MNDLVGRTLCDRYHVQSLIGRGGMAEVYKVWDAKRAVHLAMKVLREDLAEDKIFLRRFGREANTLAQLQHPHIVRFYGLEQDENLAFILMDFIEGTTLRREIFNVEGAMPPERILESLRPICSALHYAHEMGRVHCDLKPGNVMINQNGVVLVTDFGVARMMDAATATMVGAGTPAYMAPEQVRGLDPKPQTDIYALGVVLFEMLTGGERPFTGESATITGTTGDKVRWEHVNAKPPSPRKWNHEISSELVQIVLRCLEKETKERYSGAIELLGALEMALYPIDEPLLSAKVDEGKIEEAIEEEYQPKAKVELVKVSGVKGTELGLVQLVDDHEEFEKPGKKVGLSLKPSFGRRRIAKYSPKKGYQPSGFLPSAFSSFLSVFKRYIVLVGLAGVILAIICIDLLGNTNEIPEPVSSQSTMGIIEPTGESVKILPTMTTEEKVAPIPPIETDEAQEQEIDSMVTATNVSIISTTSSPTLSNTPTKEVLDVDSSRISDKDGMVLLYVPEGYFIMGPPESQQYIDIEAFWIDRTEVTNIMYRRCTESGMCDEPSLSNPDYFRDSTYDDFPVIGVNWYEAQAYCDWAGRRLPTNLEWEKAARGIDGRIYPWGNVSDFDYANYGGKWGGTIGSVGSHPDGLSPYGALDMVGNVWEWVDAWFSIRKLNNTREIRGGSFRTGSWYLRLYKKGGEYPHVGRDDLGFRCAMDDRLGN